MTPADPANRLNEYDEIRRLILCDVRTAYESQAKLDAVWAGEEFLGRPDYAEALAEYDRFAQALADAGIAIERLPADERLGISAVYTHDSSLVVPGGVILGGMRNGYRGREPAALGDFYETLGIPAMELTVGLVFQPGTYHPRFPFLASPSSRSLARSPLIEPTFSGFPMPSAISLGQADSSPRLRR